MKYINISEDLGEMSKLWLGCWSFGGGDFWGNQDDSESVRTVNAAIDAGVNVFDTAELYNDGRSEIVVGKALAGKRSSVKISSKVWKENLGKQRLVNSCEDSLKRLQTDYIDIYHIHWPNHYIPKDEVFESLEQLVSQGKIISYGVCNYGEKDLSEIPDERKPVINQMGYNLFFRAIEHFIAQKADERNIPIAAYSPLAQGLLTGKYNRMSEVSEGVASTRLFSPDRKKTRHSESGCEPEIEEALFRLHKICGEYDVTMSGLALFWLLQKPNIASVIMGARTPEQLEQNLYAFNNSGEHLPYDELDRITENIKDYIGPNADMWDTESRIK